MDQFESAFPSFLLYFSILDYAKSKTVHSNCVNNLMTTINIHIILQTSLKLIRNVTGEKVG
jgi:hypothetical protein